MLEIPPIVTVVLPCFNGADFLPASVNSCISQTFKDWELIIVNDCSTDNTLEVACKFAEKDKRIRVITNERNLKLPASLNRGFHEACGKYFTWISDDNLMHPTMLEEFVIYLNTHLTAGMVIANFNIIDDNSHFVRTVFTQDPKLYMPLNNYVGCSFMYRREVAEVVGEYNEELFLVEDYDYWIRIWQKFNIGRIDKILYSFRVHSKSLTAKYKQQISNKLVSLRLTYFDDFEDFLKLHPTLLCVFYARIVDALHGVDKWNYFWKFTALKPIKFGCRYLFIHCPNRFIKQLLEK